MRLKLLALLATTLSAIGCNDTSIEVADISPAERTLIASGYQYLDPGEVQFEVNGLDPATGRIYLRDHTDEAPQDPFEGAAALDCNCSTQTYWPSTWVNHNGAFCYNGVCTPIVVGILEDVWKSNLCEACAQYIYFAPGSSTHPGHITSAAEFDTNSPSSTCHEKCGRLSTCSNPCE
jgi:hypothetical protein